MLSFELINEGTGIQILCDSEGVDKLVSALEKIKAGSSDHVHLYAPSAGGNALSDVTPFGGKAIGEVIITGGGDL